MPSGPAPFSPNHKVEAIQLDRPVRGTLERHPLAYLLVRLATDGATGSLKLTRGKVRKVIFILNGRPIYVDSNLRNETLGAYLLSQNAIDEAQLGRAMKFARANNKKLGEALTELKMTTHATITAGLKAQTQIKIISALRWHDGAFSFMPGDDFSGKVPTCPVEPVRLALAALKRFARADQLTSIHDALMDRSLQLTESGLRHRRVLDDVFGPTLVERLAYGLTVGQVIGEGLDQAAALVQIKAMLVTAMAEVTDPITSPPGGEAPGAEAEQMGAASSIPIDIGGDLEAEFGASRPAEELRIDVEVPLEPVQEPPTDAYAPAFSSRAPAISATQIPPALSNSAAGERPHYESLELPIVVDPAAEKKAPIVPAPPPRSVNVDLDLSEEGGAPSSRPPIPAPHRAGQDLELLDPTKSQPYMPAINIELFGPSGETSEVETGGLYGVDSGVLDLPAIDGLELEERDPDALPPVIAGGDMLVPPSLEASAGPPPTFAEAEAEDKTTPFVALPKTSVEAEAPPEVPPPPVLAAEGAVAEAGKALLDALNRAYEGVHDKTYYEVLGAKADASAAELKAAYEELDRRFSASTYAGVDLGEDEDKRLELNMMIEQASMVLLDPQARQSYDERLKIAEPQQITAAPDSFGAELFFQDGKNRLRSGDLSGAVEAFTSAATQNAGQPDYHAFLGWALFLRRGRGEAGAMAARPHLERAVAIASDSAQARELASMVEEDVRNYRAVADHLLVAIKSQAPRIDLFNRLRDALDRLGDHVELERQYRNMIFRLRTTEPKQTVPLWLELAYLYRDRLRNVEQARRALDVAIKLAPNDPKVQAAKAAIAAVAEVPWDQLAQGQLERLQSNPDAPAGPLKELYLLHEGTGRDQELFIAAALLVGLKAADANQRATYERLRPQALGDAAPLGPALDTFRDEADDVFIEQIVAQLTPTICRVCPVSLEQFGSSDLDRLADIGLPRPFAAALQHVANRLSVAAPPLYLSSKVKGIIPHPGDEPRLLVGARLLENSDLGLLAFTIGRAMACVSAGRRHIFSRRASNIKTAFLAGLAIARPASKIADPQGEIGRFRKALEEGGADLGRLQSLFSRLLGSGGTINLSEWMRGARRTAARIGLMIARDPRVAVEIVGDDQETRRDLVVFSLGTL